MTYMYDLELFVQSSLKNVLQFLENSRRRPTDVDHAPTLAGYLDNDDFGRGARKPI